MHKVTKAYDQAVNLLPPALWSSVSAFCTSRIEALRESDDEGATLIEWVVLIGLVVAMAAVIVGAMQGRLLQFVNALNFDGGGAGGAE